MVSSRTCAGSPPIYVRSSTVDLYGKESHTIYDDKLETHGKSDTTISWTSDLQTNLSVEKKDAVRKVYLTVENTIKIDHKFVDVGLFKDDVYEAHFDVAMKHVWEISAGKAGVIDIKKLDNQSNVPAIGSDGQIKWTEEARNGRYGAYMTQNNDKNTIWEIFKGIASFGESVLASKMLDMVQSASTGESYHRLPNRKTSMPTDIMVRFLTNHVCAAGYADSLSDSLVKNIKTEFDSIKNKVIMPAGNVFNYAGVDIDGQGNLFVYISFTLGIEGVD